jgi:acetoin utilization deacetylase AcuC-like enzyme
MITIYSDVHSVHKDAVELVNGEIAPCHETPDRAIAIAQGIQSSGGSEIMLPYEFDLSAYTTIHSESYVNFLAEVWADWSAAGRDGCALPTAWPIRADRTGPPPTSVDAQLGFYSMDTCAPITAGTWRAVCASANSALTAAAVLSDGAPSAFALCRPPGHHASVDCMGGYCYLNNAALAAQSLRDSGAKRVAILDVDYHHGNGTQSIFYDRSDILFASIHADTSISYPYFSGSIDERGRGKGEGFNANYPLPHGTTWAVYRDALTESCLAVKRFSPDAIVVSLGVDTHKADPIGKFRLETEDFRSIGSAIAKLKRPTVIVMEGGYVVDELAANVIKFLSGFEGLSDGI